MRKIPYPIGAMIYAPLFVFLVLFPSSRVVFARTAAPDKDIAKSVSQAVQSAESGRTGEALEAFLRTMELHPGSASLVIPHLDRLVGGIYTGAQKRSLDGSSLGPRERRAILETAYKSLLSTVEDEAMRTFFMDGRKAFDEGRFLEAYDLFLLCRFLGPPDGWLADAVENYLKSRIPEAIKSRFSKEPSLLAETYLSGFRAFAELNWNRALQELESHSWAASRQVSRADKDMVEEITRISKILRTRAIKPETPEGLEAHINRLCSDDAEPAGAAAGLTHLMLYYHDQNAPWWKNAASGIRKAYTAISVSTLLQQARAAFTRNDLKTTAEILITALQKSPRNPGALSLLDEMQVSAQSGQKPGEENTVPAGPPTETAPGQKKTPTLAEKTQAQAYYNRGLSAYLLGNIKTAAEEWNKAILLDPDDENTGKALERIRKELGTGGQQP